MFACPDLIEETGRFRKLILGVSGQDFPPSNKLRFPVENFNTSPSYAVTPEFQKVSIYWASIQQTQKLQHFLTEFLSTGYRVNNCTSYTALDINDYIVLI